LLGTNTVTPSSQKCEIMSPPPAEHADTPRIEPWFCPPARDRERSSGRPHRRPRFGRSRPPASDRPHGTRAKPETTRPLSSMSHSWVAPMTSHHDADEQHQHHGEEDQPSHSACPPGTSSSASHLS